MFKKISIILLGSLLFVGCSGEGEKEKGEEFGKGYEESVAAFISSNKNVAGYGHIDVNRILSKGQLESNSMFQMFAGGEYKKLKQEIDFTHPIYFAVESPEESGVSTSYFFFKVKDQKKLEGDLSGAKGFVIKDAGDGINYTEDGDMVLGMSGEVAVAVVKSGDFNGKQEVQQAFKWMGQKADDKVKKTLKATGDVVFNIDMERMAAKMPDSKDMSKAMLKDGTAKATMNFEKGQFVIEGSADMNDEMKEALGLNKSAEPLLAKRLMDATGNTLIALQMSANLKGLPGNVFESEEVEKAMNDLTANLAFISDGLSISDLDNAEVEMPGNGEVMGDKMFEAFVDFDAVTEAMASNPSVAMFISKLDYATYEVDGNKAKLVIRTHESNENFLVTLLNLASEAYMAAMSGNLSI